MPVSVPSVRAEGGETPAHEGSSIPAATAAPGPPMATCRECGVVVRFMEGFAPALTGWKDGICLACRIRAARQRAAKITREEQKQTILEECRRDPDATVDEISEGSSDASASRMRCASAASASAFRTSACLPSKVRRR